MTTDHLHREVRALLDELIEGRTVKRSRHELLWETRDLTGEFRAVLEAHGYHPTTVAQVALQPGERVPAFYIDGSTTYFGWVFWEKFSDRRLRKLFGSVVRNSKGDWSVQLGERQHALIYANTSLKTDMDIDNPSGV